MSAASFVAASPAHFMREPEKHGNRIGAFSKRQRSLTWADVELCPEMRHTANWYPLRTDEYEHVILQSSTTGLISQT